MSTDIQTLVSWCPGQTCDPCKPPILPPPVAGEWKPPPVTAFLMVYYLIQDQIDETGAPTGGSYLAGIAGQWISSAGTGPFEWTWGPVITPSIAFSQSPYFIVGIDYYDGTGPHFAQGSYGSSEEAIAIGQAFQQYYFP